MSGDAPQMHTPWATDEAWPRFRDLGARRLVREKMDDPNIDPKRLAQAFRGLRRINVVSATAGSIWKVIRKHAKRTPVRVLDLACGSGDLTVALARRARREELPVAFEGCDLSGTAIRLAREEAEEQNVNVRFFEHDALQESMPGKYDVVFSSLFLHHLPTSEATRVLAKMNAAARVVIVNDLIRSRAGLVLAYVGCLALTRSPVVHFDGPSSVAAAFTIPEIHAMAVEAGLDGCSITPKWPYRFILTHEKEGPG